MRWLKPFAAWLLILVLAVLNGLLRESVLLSHLSRPAAFILSGLLLSLAILAVAFALARWMGLTRGPAGLAVGAGWLVLTLLFEFGFGRLVQQRPWPELLQAYTFQDGNIWPLVLLVTFIAPWLAARLRAPSAKLS